MAALEKASHLYLGHVRLGFLDRRSLRHCSTSGFPKNMPMSCINRVVGNTPVEPGFYPRHWPAEMGHSLDGRWRDDYLTSFGPAECAATPPMPWPMVAPAVWHPLADGYHRPQRLCLAKAAWDQTG